MIEELRIRNFKALRDVTLSLSPLHVLIGPNDSGKTSILLAVNALCRSINQPLADAFMGPWDQTDLVWRGEPDGVVSFLARLEADGARGEYFLACRFPPSGRNVVVQAETWRPPGESQPQNLFQIRHPLSWVCRATHGEAATSPEAQNAARFVHNALMDVHYYRWNPRFLALPAAPDSTRRFRMEPSGFGLALCLDDLLGFDRDRFTALERRFRDIFPDIKSIKLIAEPAYKGSADATRQIPILQNAEGKGIYFEFTNGDKLISASQVSDGVLLVLAYLTVLYLPQPPRVILVEEPENGIHPKRLADVLRILRDLVGEQAYTQVLLTTHSPYVLDLFQPEEVTLCKKEPDGSVSVHRLSDSKTVRDQLDVFSLGEIWTAEGDEALAAKDGAAEGVGP